MHQILPKSDDKVIVAISRARTSELAASEIKSQLNIASTAFILLFIPPHLPSEDIAQHLSGSSLGCDVFGCTSAGQITPSGYEDETLLALAFPKKYFRCRGRLINDLSVASMAEIAKITDQCNDGFTHQRGWNRFALVLTDALSKQEDFLITAICNSLGQIPLFGGSAGDGLEFENTNVVFEGKSHSKSAVLLLVETNLPVLGLGFHHFKPTDQHFVITSAQPDERIVHELNGAPAAEEYARIINVQLDDLSPETFAKNPLLVRSKGAYHVRAIQGVTENHGLQFIAAIDDGLILTLGLSTDIIPTLEQEFSIVDARNRPPLFILGFDCFLRRLEIGHRNLQDEASACFKKYNVLGFNTYGEQHRGVHVNQTFVGLAFFDLPYSE